MIRFELIIMKSKNEKQREQHAYCRSLSFIVWEPNGSIARYSPSLKIEPICVVLQMTWAPDVETVLYAGLTPEVLGSCNES